MTTEHNMDHLRFLAAVAAHDLDVVHRKEATYQGSWKRSGGRSAWMMVRRKIDRLLTMMSRPANPAGWNPTAPALILKQLTGGAEGVETLAVSRTCLEGIIRDVDHLERCYMAENIFTPIRKDPSGDDGSVLAEVRDLRRYLLLVEAEMCARGVIPLTDLGDAGRLAIASGGVTLAEALREDLVPLGTAQGEVEVMEQRLASLVEELTSHGLTVVWDGRRWSVQMASGQALREVLLPARKYDQSTLAQCGQIKADFYHLMAQEWAVEPDEGHRRIEEALRNHLSPRRPGTPEDGGHHADTLQVLEAEGAGLVSPGTWEGPPEVDSHATHPWVATPRFLTCAGSPGVTRALNTLYRAWSPSVSHLEPSLTTFERHLVETAAAEQGLGSFWRKYLQRALDLYREVTQDGVTVYVLVIDRAPPHWRRLWPVLRTEYNAKEWSELPPWQCALYRWDEGATKHRILEGQRAWTEEGP